MTGPTRDWRSRRRGVSLYRHTLVIGGTGMLRAASIELAKQSDSMTSIARTEASLANLDEHISVAGGRHRLIAQDYTQLSASALRPRPSSWRID